MDDLNMDAAQAERIARRRRRGLVRPYVENLLSDTRLREALTDEQAQAVLDWGVAHIEAQAAALPDPAAADAGAYIEAQAFQVGRVLRAINLLLLLPQTDSEDRTVEWEHIETALTALGLGSEARLARLAVLRSADAPRFEPLLEMLMEDSAESLSPPPSISPPPLLTDLSDPTPDSFTLEPVPTLSAAPADLLDPSAEMPTFPKLTSLAPPIDLDS